jgi:hypothetical protein
MVQSLNEHQHKLGQLDHGDVLFDEGDLLDAHGCEKVVAVPIFYYF